MATQATAERRSIRDRYRTQVQDEVKAIALQQLADGGAGALSINAIAKQLGLSGPALYRYFPSRDALLTALVQDAYYDFATELLAATAPERELDPVGRVRALTAAYRGWAKASPHRYRLLFREPVPGYDAHTKELVTAAQELMAVALEVIEGLGQASMPADDTDWAANTGWVVNTGKDAGWARNVSPETNPEPALGFRGVIFWARIHGLVDLELNGNYASMRLDPGVFYEYEIAQLIAGH